jgi:hypothetical protein
VDEKQAAFIKKRSVSLELAEKMLRKYIIPTVHEERRRGMKKATVGVVSLLCFSLAFFVFFFVLGTQAKMGMERPMVVKADGKALWDYLKKENYARNWNIWPGKNALYPGKEPHGALLTAYVNKVAYDAIKEKRGMFSDGSIIVKENYTADKKLAALTVMYKVKGYNPQAGDWFWAKYLPDGKIAAEGRVDACIQCHSMAKANDYIMIAPLK